MLYPPNNRAPEAVVHFLGGAFVGAAPQLSYRLFLEALSNRNALVSEKASGRYAPWAWARAPTPDIACLLVRL